MSLITFLIFHVWMVLGGMYFFKLWATDTEIPNQDKYRIIILFGGPIVWFAKIIQFVLSAIKPVFNEIDNWIKSE